MGGGHKAVRHSKTHRAATSGHPAARPGRGLWPSSGKSRAPPPAVGFVRRTHAPDLLSRAARSLTCSAEARPACAAGPSALSAIAGGVLKLRPGPSPPAACRQRAVRRGGLGHTPSVQARAAGWARVACGNAAGLLPLGPWWRAVLHWWGARGGRNALRCQRNGQGHTAVAGQAAASSAGYCRVSGGGDQAHTHLAPPPRLLPSAHPSPFGRTRTSNTSNTQQPRPLAPTPADTNNQTITVAGIGWRQQP